VTGPGTARRGCRALGSGYLRLRALPDNEAMRPLRARIRAWTIAFIAGLFISGATALPIPTAVAVGSRVLGPDLSAGGRLPGAVAEWLRTVRSGVETTAAQAPFMFYGTDWLAFGHFVIGLAFIGAVRDPVRNRWLYQFGMLACALVPVWAVVFGHIRGIPPWWRVTDAAFGIVGFVPMWLCHRWSRELETMA
jgi:hypothetical protein